MDKRGRNWRAKYLTMEQFEKFLGNDFWHLKWKVDFIFWVVLAILGAFIVKWVIGS